MRTKIGTEFYEYTDADIDVVLTRSVDDILHAKRGSVQKCMNANCIARLASQFPYPVIGSAVYRTVAFVFDKPGHAVRYMLKQSETKEIDRHDAKGIAETGVLHLLAPVGRQKTGSGHDRNNSGGHGSDGSRAKQLPPGEAGRLVALVGAGK